MYTLPSSRSCTDILAQRAGFFPGANYIISLWYPPERTQTRLAVFYAASAASGAFSGILAFGITRMDGVGGYEGWRWIFLLEGIATAVVGAACFFILPNMPRNSTGWLTTDDIRYLELSLVRTRGVAVASSKKKYDVDTFSKVLKDWRLYLLGLIFMSNTGPIYGLKFTMPAIIQNMGYTSSTSQLLSAP